MLVVHAGLSSSDGTLQLQGVESRSHSADMTQTGVALSHSPASAQSVSVPTVDFATVLLGVRELLSRGGGSGDSKGGQIVMKMDLETEEYTVLPYLISRSALCELDVVYVEWHPKLCGKNDPKFGYKALCNGTKHLRAHRSLLSIVCFPPALSCPRNPCHRPTRIFYREAARPARPPPSPWPSGPTR